MPYLHWETDRKREALARIIDHASERHREENNRKNKQETDDRKERRQGLEIKKHGRVGYVSDDESFQHLLPAMGKTWIRQHVPGRTLTEIVANTGIGGRRKGDDVYFDKFQRLIVPNKLGQFLLDAARLYEEMSTYRDKEMVEKYLYTDAPLHPRRTLDQSYYWTLKTTKSRDRDQVVYRETHSKFAHALKPPKKPKGPLANLSRRQPKCELHWIGHTPRRRDYTANSLTSSTDKLTRSNAESELGSFDGGHEVCKQCRDDIRAVSRVVMVDQLWMWILDEKTIITAFPKRYGFNKGDVSGVHRSIRSRLATIRKNEVRTVYDLALIIVDECANTFFERTKTKVRNYCTSFFKPSVWLTRS